MRRAVAAGAAAGAMVLCLAPGARAAIQLQTVASGLSQPVHVTSPPQDPTRLYVAQKAGAVRLVRDDVLAPTPVVEVAVDSDGEEGLLSLAFPPDHAQTGLFYLFYTADVPGVNGSDLVVEERRLAPGGETVDSAYGARPVLRIDHRSFSNHNGGQMQFGPDGNLWIGTGDGGSGNDPNGHAQNPTTLLGKMLRIAPTPGGGYTIPAGNPFRAEGGAPEVWATGLRNPWRWSFDRGTGDLYIGDVGQGRAEEINRVPAAGGVGCRANYGWDRFEGIAATAENTSGAAPEGYVAPLFEHLASSGWKAIAGGFVVRDRSLPEIAGSYVYGDFFVDALHLADPAAGQAGSPIADVNVDALSSLGEDARGRVYAVSLSGGTVQRLVSTTSPQVTDLVPPARFTIDTCGPRPASPPAPTQLGSPPPGGPGPGPPGSLAIPVPTDRVAPRLVFTGTSRRQRALRRGSVLLRATCNETCGVAATGRLAAAGSRASLVPARRPLTAGRPATLRLRLGPTARAAARRALRRGTTARVTLSARATDAAGNAARRAVHITLA